MLQELTITFLPYQGIICVIMLLSIGAYGIIKRKFDPLLGILCAVLILAGQYKIGFLGVILLGVQILIWNIVVSRRKTMRCKECSYKVFEQYNSGKNRYYCTHPKAVAGVGSRVICKTKQRTTELSVKTSPRWCPLKK